MAFVIGGTTSNLEFHEISHDDLWSHSVELVPGVTVAHKHSAAGLAPLYHFIIEELAAVSEATDRLGVHHGVAARDVGLFLLAEEQESFTINGLGFSTIVSPDRIMHSASRTARYTCFQHLYAGTNHLTYGSDLASDLGGTQLPGVDSDYMYPWGPRELQRYIRKLLQGLGVSISGENQQVSTQADRVLGLMHRAAGRRTRRSIANNAGFMQELTAMAAEMALHLRVLQDFGKLPFSLQVSNISALDLFVGVAGAGMVHILFLRPGKGALELQWAEPFLWPLYSSLAAQLPDLQFESARVCTLPPGNHPGDSAGVHEVDPAVNLVRQLTLLWNDCMVDITEFSHSMRRLYSRVYSDTAPSHRTTS